MSETIVMIKALIYILMTFFGFVLLRNLFNEIQRIAQPGHQSGPGRQTHKGDIVNAYSALGADPRDSDEEIRAKYRRLAKKYHPDLIQGKDLAEDFIKFANERTSEIKGAYETIMAERKGSRKKYGNSGE
jgi:DnaJ like chaperone protein